MTHHPTQPLPMVVVRNKPIDWLRYRRGSGGFAYVGCGRRSVWHVARTTTDADMWTLEEMPNQHPGCWFATGAYPTAAARPPKRRNFRRARRMGRLSCG